MALRDTKLGTRWSRELQMDPRWYQDPSSERGKNGEGKTGQNMGS